MMKRLLRWLSRPRAATAAIAVLVAGIAPLQLGLLSKRRAPVRPPVASAPAFDDFVAPRRSVPPLTPSPSPTPPKAKPTRSAATKPPAPPPLTMFGGLGAWIDLYDFSGFDPAAGVATMRAHGVRTLYIQTGRYNTDAVIAPEVGPWLVAAHQAGIKVVGWYLPSYRKMTKDVDRTVAMLEYRFAGHRLDGIGVDIEFKGDVRHVPTWNDRVVEHLERVRRAVRARVPVAAIVPPPLQMDVAPLRWAGFPWRGIAAASDVVMLMSYWSFRDCEDVPEHCAYPFTVENVRETRRLIGRRMPIHTIGGVGDSITRGEVEDFVRGARDADAYGASLYDMRTTSSRFWSLLSRLRSL